LNESSSLACTRCGAGAVRPCARPMAAGNGPHRAHLLEVHAGFVPGGTLRAWATQNRRDLMLWQRQAPPTRAYLRVNRRCAARCAVAPHLQSSLPEGSRSAVVLTGVRCGGARSAGLGHDGRVAGRIAYPGRRLRGRMRGVPQGFGWRDPISNLSGLASRRPGLLMEALADHRKIMRVEMVQTE